jgi:two-component system sensor histidine kinase YesM
MKATTKMLLGYCLLIVLPFMYLGVHQYRSLNQSAYDQGQRAQDSILEGLHGNIQASLVNLESISNIFQYSQDISDYFSQTHTIEEAVYEYIRSIRSLFPYAKFHSNLVDTVTIYTDRSLLDLPSNVLFSTGLPYYANLKETLLSTGKSVWIFDEQQQNHKYYTLLTHIPYGFPLGILEIGINSTEFFAENWNTLKDVECTYSRERIVLFSQQAGISDTGQLQIISTMPIQKLGGQLTISKAFDGLKRGRGLDGFLGIGLILFLCFSLLYYFVAVSIGRDLISLSRHFEQPVSSDGIVQYEKKTHLYETQILINMYNRMAVRINTLIHEVYLSKIEQQNAEFYALQAQINPHFLYNTLECIRMNAEYKNETDTAEAIYTLARYMRYNVSAKDKIVTLAQEVENARDYLLINKYRMEDIFQFSIEVDCDISRIRCPFFLLQPILENALIHGLRENPGTGKIQVLLGQTENGYTLVDIIDNGIGITSDILDSLNDECQPAGGHVGIQNVRLRLRSFYGQDASLTVTGAPGKGTSVHLVIPQAGEL